MSNYFNIIHQDIVIASLLYFMGESFVLGMFTLITSWDKLSFPQLLISGTGATESFAAILIFFGVFGRVYADSIKTIECLRTSGIHVESDLESRKTVGKIVKSLQPLKIKIGSVNFVDRLTPVTFIDFCFGILVNMLLLK